MYVFERYAHEKTVLHDMELELGGMQPMPEEELNAVRTRYEWARRHEAGLRQRITQQEAEGIELRAPFAVAFRRLSIIDLAGGHQPIWNEDRSIAVVCNGEIYNAPELRAEHAARGYPFRSRGDIETILPLYEAHGADAVAGRRGAARSGRPDERRRDRTGRSTAR